jgi:transcriptional regulator with XRE-family HTH domain
VPSVHRSPTIGEQVSPGAVTVPTPGLRYWRTQRARLQQELADLAGVGVMSVHRGESGWPLRLNIIRRLAVALEVDPRDLMAQPPAS